MEAERAHLMNMGYGIELADELAVCAAIVQEFMTSPALTGLYENKLRFFAVDRERKYLSLPDIAKGKGRTKKRKQRRQRADLVIEKHEKQPDGSFAVNEPRTWIEAKRSHLWRCDLGTGHAWPYKNQLKDICKDVKKLVREREHREEKAHGKLEEEQKRIKIYTRILIWGTYERNPELEHPSRYLLTLESMLNNDGYRFARKPSVKWLPTFWEGVAIDLFPSVTRAAWVALAEV